MIQIIMNKSTIIIIKVWCSSRYTPWSHIIWYCNLPFGNGFKINGNTSFAYYYLLLTRLPIYIIYQRARHSKIRTRIWFHR